MLSQEKPTEYNNSDLLKYREIILLTNAYKRHFKKGTQILSNKSKKYKDIISKLFLPNRIYLKNKCKSVQRSEKINEESEEVEPYNDVNQLVDRLKELENYVNRV